MGDSRIKDISALLSSFFDESKIRRGERYSDFFSSWPALVGERLAAHSHVADINKGILIVEAEHPGWIQLLQMRQSSILDNVVHRFPELGLRGIVFKLSERIGAPRTPATLVEETICETQTEALSEEGEAMSEKTSLVYSSVENIEDPEFRALFSSLKKTMQGKD